jgi:hypothetical protein
LFVGLFFTRAATLLLANPPREVLGLPMTIAHLSFLTGAARFQHITGGTQAAPQHAHAVRQQAAVGWVMDVRFGHAAVAAHFTPAAHTVLLSQPHDPIIDAMQRRRANQALARLERTVVRTRVSCQRTEDAPLHATVDFVFGAAIAPVLQASRHGRA